MAIILAFVLIAAPCSLGEWSNSLGRCLKRGDAQLMKGGDAVYAALAAVGVDTVFGIPAQHNLEIYDAIVRHGGIRIVGARHEQGAVHAADGYARATGKLGVAIVSTGPATANAMPGLFEAAFASSPVLLITTQVDRLYVGKQKAYIHQADRQLEMLRSVVRRAERIETADTITDTILSVVADIERGRPQPGAVEIPMDLLGGPAPSHWPTYVKPQPGAAAGCEEAAKRLRAAERPLIWVGGGCASPHTASYVVALAERLNAAVVSTPNARGVMPADHPLYLGPQSNRAPLAETLQGADCILAVGTRFQASASNWFGLRLTANLIHADADAGVIGRTYPASLALIGDAAVTMEQLLHCLPAAAGAMPAAPAIASARARAADELNTVIGPDHCLVRDTIDRLMPESRIVVADSTVPGLTWGMFGLTVNAPRSAFYVTGYAIGPALPIGLGAAIGTGRRTLVIHGDGGVMLNLSELATIVETRAPVITCVFNDGGYGILKQIQEATTQRQVGVDLHTPDFVGVAKAMGMPAFKAGSAAEFEPALIAALAIEGPSLIEIDLTHFMPIRLF